MSEANALKMALDHLWFEAHFSSNQNSEELLQAIDTLSNLLLKAEKKDNPLPWER